MENRSEPTESFARVLNGDFNLQLFSAFVQDEIRLLPHQLVLTAGTKLEHTAVTGFELQPNVRVTFKPAPKQLVWAAVSRAVRTPNALESRDVFAIALVPPIQGPGGLYLPALIGNPEIRSEVLHAYEAGYRAQAGPNVSVEFAGFYNRYREIIGFDTVPRFEPGFPIGAAVITWANLLRGNSLGGEVALNVTVTRQWRLSGTYSALRVNIRPTIETASSIGWTAPEHQFTLRSSHDLPGRTTFDLQFRGVSGIRAVPAYQTADLRLAWRLTAKTELSLVGRNLLDARHPEQPLDPLGSTTAEVPRRFQAKLTWRF